VGAEGPVRGGMGGGGQRGLTRAVYGGAARWGEADDGGGDRWSPGVPDWSVMGYASEQSTWGWQRGRPSAEAAVHMEALAAAPVEGIWWWRRGPKVDGAGSRFRKLLGVAS
jgi:hypothetical protein